MGTWVPETWQYGPFQAMGDLPLQSHFLFSLHPLYQSLQAKENRPNSKKSKQEPKSIRRKEPGKKLGPWRPQCLGKTKTLSPHLRSVPPPPGLRHSREPGPKSQEQLGRKAGCQSSGRSVGSDGEGAYLCCSTASLSGSSTPHTLHCSPMVRLSDFMPTASSPSLLNSSLWMKPCGSRPP